MDTPSPNPNEPAGRRPLKSRDLRVFRALAGALARGGVTPNFISFMSIVFAAAAGLAVANTSEAHGPGLRWFWIAGAVGIQLRLVANLLDGMVAVEGGKGGPVGDLWNEAPDRLSDALIFIGLGFASGSEPLLGFSAALVAVMVAYARALAASVGAGQIFVGPQAKPQRMAVATVACVACAALPEFSTGIVRAALAIVIGGGLVTAWRRLALAGAWLRQSKNPDSHV